MRPLIRSSAGSLALAAGIVLLSTVSLQAGASNKNGNPFGNGTFFQDTGTFSAVVRGQNLSGTMLFSTGYNQGSNSAGSNNSSGSCVLSYLGSPDGSTQPGVYNGNAAGMWDPSSGQISGQFWGSYTLSGSNTFTNWSEVWNTNSFPVILSVPTNIISYIQSNTVVAGITNTVSIPVVTTVTNILALEPYGSNSYNDAAMMNGNFDGYVQNKYPNQTFTAQGTISQQQLSHLQQGAGASSPIIDTNGNVIGTNFNQEGSLPQQMAAPLQIPVTVQGLRVSDAYSTFSTVSNSIPYAITTYGVTNVPNQQGGF